MQPRSPAYPGASLDQAIGLIEKIHTKNRTNPIDREAAAKEMGFAGLTGSSTKALADLAHYGLIEKTGKGSLRVSQRAVDILYPVSASGKVQAMREAAFSPALFGALNKHFHDGMPSENALRGYLIRQQFVSAAIPYVVKGYLETCRLLQQEAGSESHGYDAIPEQNSPHEASPVEVTTPFEVRSNISSSAGPAPSPDAPQTSRNEGYKVVEGEREIMTGLLSKGASFRLIVSGKVGEIEIDRLIRKLELDKEILAVDAETADL